MNTKIKDIVEIGNGYQFRGKVKPVVGKAAANAIPFIQIKDVDPELGLDPTDIVRVDIDSNVDRYLVNRGDVLFLARGLHQFATAIDHDLQNTIVTSYFFILRPKTDTVLPEYLAWFINHPKFQGRWKSFMRGTHIKMVSKTDLENSDVDIPTLEVQHRIVELERLRLQAERLNRDIEGKRTQLIQSISMKAALQSSGK